MVINSKQIRAARMLLGISQQDLSNMSGVSLRVIGRIEQEGEYSPKVVTLEDVQISLEKKGIEFINVGKQKFGVVINEIVE